jgi:hypothetical protein
MRVDSEKLFTQRDMQITRRINPFVACIGGHSVKPYIDFGGAELDVAYITLLRDPVQRYLSQYNYWVKKLGKEISFSEYLELPWPQNFQTKKIAGKEDVDLAKEYLADRFFLVGLVERFDEFLLALQRKLRPHAFDPRYETKNVLSSSTRPPVVLDDRVRDAVVARNRLDIELYDFAKNELVPKYAHEAAGYDHADSESPPLTDGLPAKAKMYSYLDAGFRKIYLEPVTGLIRRYNGKPMKGSY